MKKKQMCVDFQSKLSGVTNMRQEFMVCQIKSHFSIVCRFSLFSLKKTSTKKLLFMNSTKSCHQRCAKV